MEAGSSEHESVTGSTEATNTEENKPVWKTLKQASKLGFELGSGDQLEARFRPRLREVY